MVPHRNSTVEEERSSRCTVHRNITSAGQPPAIRRHFFISTQTKACDMFIKQWGSHYCTQEPFCHYANTQLLTHEASEKRGKLPPPLPPFLTRLPEIVHSAGGPVRHFQTVKVVQESFLELQLKCPHWESINWHAGLNRFKVSAVFLRHTTRLQSRLNPYLSITQQQPLL